MSTHQEHGSQQVASDVAETTTQATIVAPVGELINTSVEQIPELFNNFGAPGEAISVEQMPELFNRLKPEEGNHEDTQPPLGQFARWMTQLPSPMPLVRRGRPAVLTPKLQEQLCMLLSVGLSRRQAAAYLGIEQSTVSRTIARDEQLALDVQEAETLNAVEPLLTLVAESRKNWRAAAWLLRNKNLAKPELSEEEKQERHAARMADLRRKMELEGERKALEKINYAASNKRYEDYNLALRQAECAREREEDAKERAERRERRLARLEKKMQQAG